MVTLRGEVDGVTDNGSDIPVSHVIVHMDNSRVIGELKCPDNVPFGASLVSIAGMKDSDTQDDVMSGMLWAAWWWNSSSDNRIIYEEGRVISEAKERNSTRYGNWGVTSHNLVCICVC